MRNLLPRLAGLGATASVVFVVLASPACGSDDGSTFTDPNAAEAGFEDGSFNPNNKPDSGDPFANDPPPQYCVIDGGPAQVTVTGHARVPERQEQARLRLHHRRREGRMLDGPPREPSQRRLQGRHDGVQADQREHEGVGPVRRTGPADRRSDEGRARVQVLLDRTVEAREPLAVLP